ncbi:MAG: hypothetical protein U0V75_11295 [Ferruginibacter sp.]
MKKILTIIICCTALVAHAQKQKSKKAEALNTEDLQKMMNDAMKDLAPEQKAITKDLLDNKLTTLAQNIQNPDADKAYYDYLLNQSKRSAFIGTTTKASIGKAGGKITSSSGKFTFDFPPAALQGDTEFTLEEIANNGTMACGNGCRLSPQNLILSQPVGLTIRYSADEINGTSPEMISILGKGINKNTVPSIDKINKTIKATIDNTGDRFLTKSDIRLILEPEKLEVSRGQTVEIKLIDRYYKDKSLQDPDDDLLPLTPYGSPFDHDLDNYVIREWKLNEFISPTFQMTKYGSILPYQYSSVLYTAPQIIPLTDRQIHISVKIQNKKTKAEFILVTEIFLITSDYFIIEFEGKKIMGFGLLDPKVLEKFKKDNSEPWTPTTGFQNEGMLSFGMVCKDIKKGQFDFILANPHIGKNIITYTDDMSQGGISALFGDLICGVEKNIYIKEQERCERKDPVYKVFTVYIDTFDNKSGGLLVGHFDEILYDAGNAAECKSSEEHHLKGRFSLTMMANPFNINNMQNRKSFKSSSNTEQPANSIKPKSSNPTSENNDDDLVPLKPSPKYSGDDDLVPLKPAKKTTPKTKSKKHIMK